MSLMALGFIAVYISGIFLALFKSAKYGLYTYLLTFYLSPASQWWGYYLPEVRWSLVIGIVTLIAIVIKKEVVSFPWYSFKETRYFALFTFYVIVQSFWALSWELHSFYLFLCLKFLILIVIIQSVNKNINDVYTFIIVNAIGCAYFGYQGLGGGRLENLGTSGIDDSNLLAQHLTAVLVFSSFLLLVKIKRGYLLYPLLILTLNGVILTESRAAIIALFITGCITMVYFNKASKKKLYIYGVLAILAFSILLGPGLVRKWSTITTDSSAGIEQDKSAESRLVIVSAQLDMFFAKPILGYGHRGTLQLSSLYMPSENLNKSGIRSSHSLIMSLLVDHGIVGSFFYLMIFYLCISKIFYLKKIDSKNMILTNHINVSFGLVAALICFIVSGLGSNNKVLEVGIWLIAIIPVAFKMTLIKEKEQLLDKDSPTAMREIT